MTQPTRTFEVIRDGILREIQGVLPDADITTDSDNYVRAAGVGAAIEGVYQHQAWLYRQIFPHSADTEALEMHAGDRGLSRKAAAAAGASARITGTAGAVVPMGSSIRLTSGGMLATSAHATLDATGQAVVRVTAVEAGSTANGLAGTGILTSAPIGVDAPVELTVPLAGGTDIESDTELLDRLLELLRRPPAGGNRYDYQRWAREVPGVTAAFVYPLRRGLGTVDVVIVSDGLPSAELIENVQRYIDERRPVTAWDCLVFGPTPVIAHIVAGVKLAEGYSLASAQAAADQQLPIALDPLAPGEALYRSQVESIISGLPGVIDRVLQTPAVNIAPVADASRVEWVRFGSVRLELLP